MQMLIDGQWVGAAEDIPVHCPYTTRRGTGSIGVCPVERGRESFDEPPISWMSARKSSPS